MVSIEISGKMSVEEDGSVIFTADGEKETYKFQCRPNGPDACAAINGLVPWVVARFKAELQARVDDVLAKANTKKG